MIVDTSAIISILLEEPEAARFLDALVAAPRCAVSAGTWIELSAVLTRKKADAVIPSLEALAARLPIIIEPVTTEQARIGWNAYREHGIGTRSKAKLNFGDCFAYALAKASGEPLLFKGGDFSETDIVAATK